MAERGRLFPNHMIQLRDPHPPLLGPHALPAHLLVETPLLRRFPPPLGSIPSIIALEDKLAAQSHEIHALLADNQHLAATHVGLKQEVDASRNELRLAAAAAGRARAERDIEVREVIDHSVKAETEARSVEGMRAELTQVRADVRMLGAAKNELLERLQGLKRDFARAREELEQASAVRAEIEAMSREIQRGRAAIEYEKKARADNLEQRQEMERNMISMAREVEKLRSELGNAEKRVRAAAAAAVTENAGVGYTDTYRNARMTYVGNAYSGAYDLHQWMSQQKQQIVMQKQLALNQNSSKPCQNGHCSIPEGKNIDDHLLDSKKGEFVMRLKRVSGLDDRCIVFSSPSFSTRAPEMLTGILRTPDQRVDILQIIV